MTLRPGDSNIPPEAFGPTPSQTVGPYFHQGLLTGEALVVVDEAADVPGTRITLRGRVLDADGQPVPDALVEVWQADAAGRYAPGPGFSGFGRSDTRHPGQEFLLRTIRPGAVAQPGGPTLAPHLNVWLGMRGLLTHLWTRIYFEDQDNSGDLVLLAVPESRRATLIARRDGAAVCTYRLDIHLQGPHETVFFQP